jgi:hypothetical protein
MGLGAGAACLGAGAGAACLGGGGGGGAGFLFCAIATPPNARNMAIIVAAAALLKVHLITGIVIQSSFLFPISNPESFC